MSIIQIRDEKGTRTLDMTFVEDYCKRLVEHIDEDKSFMLPLEGIKSLNQEQLTHLVSHLTAIAERYGRLWRFSFTKDHEELLKKLRFVKDAAAKQGMDLWPEYMGKNL